jgi:exopolyphosphatase
MRILLFLITAYFFGIMSISGFNARSVASFLKHAKSLVKPPRSVQKIHVVVGNEACDADSIVSSVCHAYLQYLKSLSNATDKSEYLPVASICRSDLHFRREVKVLLEKIHIELEDLICLEEVPLSDLLSTNKLNITLVDHNTLSSELAPYSPCCVEIVDHHQDAGGLPTVTGTKRTVAFDPLTKKATVGSTCTLIAEKYIEFVQNTDGCFKELPQEIATLLFGVILLDTINMDSAAGIGTARDAAMLEALAPFTIQPRDGLFEQLRGAKLDPGFWDELSAGDVMRIDYKAFHTAKMKENGVGKIGMAAALQPIERFLAKDGVSESIQAIMRAQQLDVVVVMSFVHEPAPTRELLLCCRSRAHLDALLQYFLHDPSHGLCMRKLEVGGVAARMADLFPPVPVPVPVPVQVRTTGSSSAAGEHLYAEVFAQGNAKASRKQLAPALVQFLEETPFPNAVHHDADSL